MLDELPPVPVTVGSSARNMDIALFDRARLCGMIIWENMKDLPIEFGTLALPLKDQIPAVKGLEAERRGHIIVKTQAFLLHKGYVDLDKAAQQELGTDWHS